MLQVAQSVFDTLLQAGAERPSIPASIAMRISTANAFDAGIDTLHAAARPS